MDLSNIKMFMQQRPIEWTTVECCSVAIGCGVIALGNNEIGFGLGKTMALLKPDGSWFVNWEEVDRIAALKEVPPNCLAPVIITFAKWLQLHVRKDDVR